VNQFDSRMPLNMVPPLAHDRPPTRDRHGRGRIRRPESRKLKRGWLRPEMAGQSSARFSRIDLPTYWSYSNAARIYSAALAAALMLLPRVTTAQQANPLRLTRLRTPFVTTRASQPRT